MKFNNKFFLLSLVIFLGLLPKSISHAGTLSCSVATSCPNGVVMYKISGLANAHGETPSQSNYTNLICCSGVNGLGNSCSGNYATLLKFSSVTNAHAEQNNQNNYPQNICMQAPSGGNVSVGYQNNNCSGYDTTLGSLSAITNAHLGDSTAYTLKICGTATAGGSLTVDIVNSLGVSVTTPSIAFTSKSVLLNNQFSDGIFGNTNERVRVSNTTTNSQWSLTLGASSGSNALWSAGSLKYDFNDPTSGAGDGADVDVFGGADVNKSYKRDGVAPDGL